LALAAEIDGQRAKARGNERSRLWLPTLFIESSPVGQHDGAATRSVQSRRDDSTISSWKGNGQLSRDEAGQYDTGEHGSQRSHGASILRCIEHLRIAA